MSEHESISNYGDSSTTIMPEGFCPLCSSNFSFVYHQGHCPKVKAKEYYQGGGLKRIEFVDTNELPVSLNFDASMELVDSTKQAREVVIGEPTLLESGRYTIILGELCRIVDDIPPELA